MGKRRTLEQLVSETDPKKARMCGLVEQVAKNLKLVESSEEGIDFKYARKQLKRCTNRIALRAGMQPKPKRPVTSNWIYYMSFVRRFVSDSTDFAVIAGGAREGWDDATKAIWKNVTAKVPYKEFSVMDRDSVNALVSECTPNPEVAKD